MKLTQLIKLILFFSLIALLFSIFYFSWLPNPSFKSEHYLPNWLIRWTDAHGTLRTGVPFLLLRVNMVLLQLKTLTNTKIFLSLFTCLFIAEFGQLFLPYRSFDVLDILVGAMAIVLGIFLGEIIKRGIS